MFLCVTLNFFFSSIPQYYKTLTKRNPDDEENYVLIGAITLVKLRNERDLFNEEMETHGIVILL